MDATAQIALIVALAAIAAYPFVMRLAAARAHPMRLRMAEVGKTLLTAPRLDETRKEQVDLLLDMAFDWRVMIGLCAALPVAVVRRRFRGRPARPAPADPETEYAWNDFMSAFTRSVAAANPLFSVVFAIEIAVLVLLLVPFGMAWRAMEIVHDTIACAHRDGTHRAH